jgi:two-component system sensor histidine kinase KdpD
MRDQMLRVPHDIRARLKRSAFEYGLALAGVALTTIFIGVVRSFLHAGNISLLYLIPVLWLAATFGRWPAIVAAVLAFLAYDFFFIPPLHRFTINDPAEWVSLFALLATALVLGQLTARVRERAREAIESQRRTATLYSLSQLITGARSYEILLAALTRRVVEVFAAAGVSTCALIVPDEQGRPVTQAISPEDGPGAGALRLTEGEQAAEARWALERSKVVGGSASGDVGQRQPAAYYFLPLPSGGRVVGMLGIAGGDGMRELVDGVIRWRGPGQRDGAQGAEGATGSGAGDATVELFAAFRDQIALAIDRATLQQQAIHTEALRESDRLKDVLLGSVTHDLRTPLASIKAAVSTLLDRESHWSEEERQGVLATINTSVDRLNRLVGNLLDLSRLEAGVALPQRDWYLIGDVIATVLDRLELTGDLDQRWIEVDVPDDLPLAPMDHAQIEQVLTNLIENALKYSPPESPIRIAAEVMGTPAELEVRVTDAGIGIPPAELDAIFGKFYRVSDVRLPWLTSRPPVGTGLGLAICASIIEAHGGRIWAESTLGKSTTFSFTLPIPEDHPTGALPDIEMDGAPG